MLEGWKTPLTSALPPDQATVREQLEIEAPPSPRYRLVGRSESEHPFDGLELPSCEAGIQIADVAFLDSAIRKSS